MVYYCSIRCIMEFYTPSWSIHCCPVLRLWGCIGWTIALFWNGNSLFLCSEEGSHGQCLMKQMERICILENYLFRLILSYLSSTSHLPEILYGWFLVKQSEVVLLCSGKVEGRATLDADYNKKSPSTSKGIIFILARETSEEWQDCRITG